MARHRVYLALAALALAGAGSWVLVSNASKPGPIASVKLPVERGGVRVSEISPGFRSKSKAVSALPRDWLVESDRLRFVVGAQGPGPARQQRLGSLRDLAGASLEEDDLRELRTVISIGGKSASTQVSGLTLDRERGAPVVRVLQRTHDGRVDLETDYAVEAGSSTVRITTRVSNTTKQLIRSVQVGDRTLWPGEPTFAPRAGFVKFTSRVEVPWVAREGDELTYVLAFGGQIFEAAFMFDRIGPLGQVTLSPPRDLLPHETIEIGRDLITVKGGLDAAAALAWRSAGREVGWIEGTLDPPPSWAIVEARYPDGKPALSVRAKPDGRYTLPLPPGEYRLVLKSPGGEDQEDVSVDEGPRPSPANLLPPRPGMLRFVITDADDMPIPGRIQVRGLAPSRDPDFGPVESAVGTGNLVYTASGQGFIEVPAGRYRVIVGHGSEYSMIQQDVEIGEDEGAALRVTLARLVDTSGFVACDFHVHAEPSHDSQVTLDDRVASLMGEGIEFVAATDHDHATDYAPTIARLGVSSHVKSTPGVEITTTTWGHFNAYPFPLEAPVPEHAGRSPAEIFATVRALAPGAVIQVNHPRMPGVGYFNRIELDAATASAQSEDYSFDFDALELANGYDLENPKVLDDGLRDYFGLLNSGRRFAVVGNSDSHRLITNWVGHPRTYVRVAVDRPDAVTAEEIARQVLGGHVSVANGIYLVALANGVAGPGDTLAEERVTLQISARAPEWVSIKRIEVFANGVLAAKRELPIPTRGPARVDWEVALDNKVDTWVMVVARGDEPMTAAFPGRRVLPYAFTNPIFIDADQDGVFHAINEGRSPPDEEIESAPSRPGSAPR